MGVPSYTTPEIVLTFQEESLDLTQAESVYVTLKSDRSKLTKSGQDLEVAEKEIRFRLEQAETANFSGYCEVQANWMIAGQRIASEIARVEFTRQLLKEVIA